MRDVRDMYVCVCVRYVSNSHFNDFLKGLRGAGRYKTLGFPQAIDEKKRRRAHPYFQHSPSKVSLIVVVPIFLNQDASQFRTSSAITTSHPLARLPYVSHGKATGLIGKLPSQWPGVCNNDRPEANGQEQTL